MNLCGRIQWNIQRKSFSKRGIWKWICETLECLQEVTKIINKF